MNFAEGAGAGDLGGGVAVLVVGLAPPFFFASSTAVFHLWTISAASFLTSLLLWARSFPTKAPALVAYTKGGEISVGHIRQVKGEKLLLTLRSFSDGAAPWFSAFRTTMTWSTASGLLAIV